MKGLRKDITVDYMISCQRMMGYLNSLNFGLLECCECCLVTREDDPDKEFTQCATCYSSICKYCFENEEIPDEKDKHVCSTCAKREEKRIKTV